MVGGAVVGPKELLDPIKFYQNAAGGVPGPFDCYLTLRGLKTLAVRMDRHGDNAAELADWLTQAPGGGEGLLPRPADHPGHAVAKKQMRELRRDDLAEAQGRHRRGPAVLDADEAVQPGREPGRRRVAGLPPGDDDAREDPEGVRARRGVDDGLIRLSVGIEDVADLREDLRRAMA